MKISGVDSIILLDVIFVVLLTLCGRTVMLATKPFMMVVLIHAYYSSIKTGSNRPGR